MKINLRSVSVTAVLLSLSSLSFGQAPALGAAASFVVFTSVGAFSSDGATDITGDIGTNAGALTGFPPGTVVGQTQVANTASTQAATDVDVAYSALAGLNCSVTIGTPFGSGQVLTPGVYCLTAASVLTGNLTLDGQGNPNAVFIIKMDGPMSTAASSNIIPINGASSANIYFQVNGAVILGAGSVFMGTILANGAITLLEGAFLQGRALSRAGAIDLHNNRITRLMPTSACACPR